MTNCKHCKAPITTMAYLSEDSAYCSKSCLRRSPEQRTRDNDARQQPVRSTAPLSKGEDVIRSPKKLGKLMKRRKSRRPVALRG
jgi:hypothetical protein